MSSNLKDLKRQMEKVYNKHPDLHDVEVVPLKSSNITLNELSDFIEKCWNYDYGNEARITFTPEFIEYNIPKINDDFSCGIAKKDGELAGAYLSFPTKQRIGEEPITSYIGTGLSTQPKYRGQGLSQLLWLKAIEFYLSSESPISYAWLDVRHNWEGTSYKIFGKDKEKVHLNKLVNFYAKSFEYDTAVEVGKLGKVEKMGIKLTSGLFPTKYEEPTGYEISPVEPKDSELIKYFIDEYQSKGELKREISPDGLVHRLGFSKNGFSSFAYGLQSRGNIYGLIFGFTNPVGNQAKFLQVDGMLFHPDVKYKDKKKFISSCEQIARDEFGCFSSVIPGSVTNDGLIRYGYVPVAKQALCAVSYTGDVALTGNRMYNLFMELR